MVDKAEGNQMSGSGDADIYMATTTRTCVSLPNRPSQVLIILAVVAAVPVKVEKELEEACRRCKFELQDDVYGTPNSEFRRSNIAEVAIGVNIDAPKDISTCILFSEIRFSVPALAHGGTKPGRTLLSSTCTVAPLFSLFSKILAQKAEYLFFSHWPECPKLQSASGPGRRP